jgi:NhaP-type Na+/H+ or K+/H+ antiporter
LDLFNLWCVIIGALFIFMALGVSTLRRLPLSTSMIYLVVGFALGPVALNFINLDMQQHAELVERFSEVVVLVSLFTAGLKLRVPLSAGRWKLPLRLATVSMLVTIGLVALVGICLLGLSPGAAILLGAILAPTDPVLASDVQVKDAFDRDRLRFSLTGEAGLNDGTATPFVLLGMGLLGLHEIGDFGWKWLALDIGWAVIGGIGIGALLGTLIGRLVIYLRREHKEAIGLDDFLGLGLIALTYGLALLLHTYGFLAVFAAGIALRRIEVQTSANKSIEEVKTMVQGGAEEELATHPEKAPAYMAQTVLGFNEQLERIGEVMMVLVIGGLLGTVNFRPEVLWIAPLLFLVIRPVSVQIGLLGSHSNRPQRRLMSWFGIRGIGSLYYLAFVIRHGLPADLADLFTSLVLSLVAISIVVHGLSVTPLMNLYADRVEHSGSKPGGLTEA